MAGGRSEIPELSELSDLSEGRRKPPEGCGACVIPGSEREQPAGACQRPRRRCARGDRGQSRPNPFATSPCGREAAQEQLRRVRPLSSLPPGCHSRRLAADTLLPPCADALRPLSRPPALGRAGWSGCLSGGSAALRTPVTISSPAPRLSPAPSCRGSLWSGSASSGGSAALRTPVTISPPAPRLSSLPA